MTNPIFNRLELADRVRGWVFRRRYNAMRVYNLLATHPVVDMRDYDNRATVTASRFSWFGSRTVQLVFTRNKARITFRDRYSQDSLTIITAANPGFGSAIAQMVASLLTQPIPAEPNTQLSAVDDFTSSTVETPTVDPFTVESATAGSAFSIVDSGAPHCCSWPMVEADPEVWFLPDEPVRVERVYRCTECDWVTNVEVTDPDQAERIYQAWVVTR